MINIQAKKHDNLSVEFKFGFDVDREVDINDFAVNMWLFVPNSMNISPDTYGKHLFYRDMKSNVRLITPVLSLEEMTHETALPYMYLKEAIGKLSVDADGKDDYEYHLKMFAAIFKSALRRDVAQLRTSKNLESIGQLTDDFYVNVTGVLKRYRSLKDFAERMPILDRKHYLAVDEYLSSLAQAECAKALRMLDSPASQVPEDVLAKLVFLLRQESCYVRRNGYSWFSKDPDSNRDVMYRHGLLKKYIESDLYIGLDKKRDGVAVEQLYYSIAAGIAMIFATAVGWLTQVKFGNITLPLFIVLVISYMLKDRIKDLMRFYFAHKLGNKYFDKKSPIKIGQNKIGELKEGVDFISGAKIYPEVRRLREMASVMDDESRILEEKVLLYRERCRIDSKALSSEKQYLFRGINEIVRLHFSRFMQKMDNPSAWVSVLERDGKVNSIAVQRLYYINVVFQLKHRSQSEYRHYSIALNRDGIIKVKELG